MNIFTIDDNTMQRVNLLLPKSFVEKVDDEALKEGTTRSGFIRLALLEKLGLQNMYDATKTAPKSVDTQALFKSFLEMPEDD